MSARLERILGVECNSSQPRRCASDRVALARYGLNVADVQDVVDSATGGERVSEMLDNLQLQSSAGEHVRQNQVAQLRVERGPEVVFRESAQRRIIVQANVRGRDLGRLCNGGPGADRVEAEPARRIRSGLGRSVGEPAVREREVHDRPADLDSDYVRAALCGVRFCRTGDSDSLECAVRAIGGMGALWVRGLNLNVSASIGFIALFGVAVLNGVVMVSYINRLRDDGVPMKDALVDGASLRLRPVRMTALVGDFHRVDTLCAAAPVRLVHA